MIKGKNQVLMAIFLAGDVVVTVISFLFAYYLRFYSNIIPVKYGVPAFQQYVNIIPLIVIVWPVIFSALSLDSASV